MDGFEMIGERSFIRVMVVDDSPAFLIAATSFLQRQDGFRVIGTAQDGEEALMIAKGLRPVLILVDLEMPRMSGLEMIPRMRFILPQTRIIALTLWESENHRIAACSAGADGFVPKRKLTTELMPAIREALALAS